jgi:hypothetical protein
MHRILECTTGHIFRCTVRVFNPLTSRNNSKTLSAAYMSHQRKKRRDSEYDRRVREVEHGTFTPIVLAPQVAWVQLQPSSSNVWLKRLPINRDKATAK